MRGMRRIHTVFELILIFTISTCFSVEITSIHEAASLGDLDKVKAFLDQGTDINEKNERGQSALHLAVSSKQKKITEHLISKGGDVNAKDKWGYTALYYAIWNNDADMVRLLVDKGADVDVRPNGDGTPLEYAVWNENLEMAKLFVAKGARINLKDSDDWTAFRYAVSQGHRQLVEFFVNKGADVSGIHGAACMGDLARLSSLLEKGVDVDVKDELGWTPLYWAASMGQDEVGEFLLDNGAKSNAKTDEGCTPLHQAANSGALRLVELLIANGADVNVEDKRGNTPLHSAAAAGHSKIVEFLITKGAEVTRSNQNSWTPLHLAARGGHKEVVKFLVAKGADVTLKDRRGLTALDWARQRGHSEVVEFLLSNKANIGTALISAAQDGDLQFVEQLLDHGADVNSQDSLGLTALHAAASTQDSNCVSLLLDRGAKVNVQDKAGRTPLHYATGANCGTANPKREYKLEIVQRLLDAGADINAQDNIGWTPIHYSAFTLNEEMVRYLIEKRADLTIVDKRGYTAYSWIRAKASYYKGISRFAKSRLKEWQGHIQKYHTVLKLLHDVPTFYVANNGADTNPGTLEMPFRTIIAAVDIAEPGDTIFIRGGMYHCPNTIHVDKSGEQGQPIRIAAFGIETPILNFSDAKGDSIIITGAYWHLKDLTITGGFRGAISLYGDKACYNILEEIQVFDNRYAGIRIEAGAAFNIFLNCDSYRNFDLEWNGEDSDGFGAYWDIGLGNILIGSRAWDNSDDGYDLWDAGNSVRLENCYAFRNGNNIWNQPFFSGNANGFKLGRGGGRHILISCLAWGHSLTGFNLNNNTDGVVLYNCAALNNELDYAFNWSDTEKAKENCVFINNISYNGSKKNGINPKANSQCNSWDTDLGLVLTDVDFLSLDDSKMSAPRNPDGSIRYNNFLRLAPVSAAIDAGVDVNMPYFGKAPDLGAFEYNPNEIPENYVKMLHQYVRDHDIPKIRELLAKGEDVNAKDWLGYAPLHWAVYFGYPDLVELLIDQGANPSLMSDTGRTPLEIAEAMEYKQIASILRNGEAKE